VSRLLAWANEQGLNVAPAGSGTKMDRGNLLVAVDIYLDLTGLAGVVEHAAGDLTVTARAGTRLADLQAVLAGENQFLAVDPPVPGTVGGLIATGDSGPRRLRYGGVRDLLLGVTFVRADGVVARGGGKVVKNVAGYDLPKLLTGSMGTLGVIVEATFRLYPLPASSATLLVRGISVRRAAEFVRQVRDSALVPTAADYFDDRAGAGGVLAVRFESSPRSTQTQAGRAHEIATALGGHADILTAGDEEALWQQFDRIVDSGQEDVLARLTSVPGDLPVLLEAVGQRASELDLKVEVRAHIGHGHALVLFREPQAVRVTELLAATRRDAEARGSNLVLWRAPEAIRREIDVWGDPGEGIGLMRSIKAQFDPKGTLSPGRFVGGI
jgi:glycolate oxidase FAD binding subunit